MPGTQVPLLPPGSQWRLVSDHPRGPGAESAAPATATLSLGRQPAPLPDVPSVGCTRPARGVPRRRRRARSAPSPPCVSRTAATPVVQRVLEDLEDFFRFLDRQRRGSRAGLEEPTGLEAAELGCLVRVQCSEDPTSSYVGEESGALRRDGAKSSTSSSPEGTPQALQVERAAKMGGEECAVCLSAFLPGDPLLALPCDPRHRLHESCGTAWLGRCGVCPLCRADVRAMLPPAAGAANHEPEPRSEGSSPEAVLASRSPPFSVLATSVVGCRTRDGGLVVRFEPNPPPGWERPVYIPPAHWHYAQYFEVSYSGLGDARIWRVPGLQLGVSNIQGTLGVPSDTARRG